MPVFRRPFNDGSFWKNSTDKVPSHFYGNQQQHDAEGDFELAGGEFVRGFDAERSKNHGGDAEDGDGGQIEEAAGAVWQIGNVPAGNEITDCACKRNRPGEAGGCADGAVGGEVAIHQEGDGQRAAADADPARSCAEQCADST
mgnify:CR=1 FL=1